jgi:hypothetical protein
LLYDDHDDDDICYALNINLVTLKNGSGQESNDEEIIALETVRQTVDDFSGNDDGDGISDHDNHPNVEIESDVQAVKELALTSSSHNRRQPLDDGSPLKIQSAVDSKEEQAERGGEVNCKAVVSTTVVSTTTFVTPPAGLKSPILGPLTASYTCSKFVNILLFRF